MNTPGRDTNACELSRQGLDYCTSRGISIATISAFELAESACHRYVLLPVCDQAGKRLFWAGRRIAPGGHVGRYVYYGSIDRSVIYGLHLADPAATHAVFVEGFFDVMVAYERGYRNFIANMGSATVNQPWWSVKRDTIASRFSHITVAFDGGPYGRHPQQQQAALLSLAQAGVVCSEVVLPPGADPASISEEQVFDYFGKPA